MSSFSLTCTLAFLFCLCNIVSADFYYYGPSIGYSVVGLIILILDIIAIVDVLRSNRETTEKLLWVLLILFFPIGGLIIYFIFRRRSSRILN